MRQQQLGLCSSTLGRSAGCEAGVSPTMRLSVTSTTGSPVHLTVPRGETVEGLRTHISQKLKVKTDRIVLLHKDRKLTAGKLLDLGVADGSGLTLVPVIEAGLVCSSARAERTLMDVLESLTEDQISDFLSGRAPLTINLGIGDHTMYVQLQLSAQGVSEMQQGRGSRDPSSNGKLQTSLPTEASVSHSGSNMTGSANSSNPPSSSRAADSADCTPPMQPSTQRPTTVPAGHCHHHSSSHHSTTILSTDSFPSGCPLQSITPVCSPDTSGPAAGPPSPVPASAFKETSIHSSTADLCKQPGAVIETFGSHSPGVFSGTFSGTLAPCNQSSIRHPRHGITIILQILDDLVRAAARHQGAPPPQLHSSPINPSVSMEEPSKAKSKPTLTQRMELLSETPAEEGRCILSSTEENQTLYCKLEHLQFLMDQRRLRRQTRRTSPTSHPYKHCYHHPCLLDSKPPVTAVAGFQRSEGTSSDSRNYRSRKNNHRQQN